MGCPLGALEPKIETDLRYCLCVNPLLPAIWPEMEGGGQKA